MKRIFLLLWHPPKPLAAIFAGALFCCSLPLMAASPADRSREAGQAIDMREQLGQRTREHVL